MMPGKTAGIIGGLKAVQARDTLRRAILFRVYEPGTHLVEQALAHELGCSQGTVREALLLLAEQGLVERRGYRGTVVTETTLRAAAEIVRVRLSIERTVAAIVAGEGVGTGQSALDSIISDMNAAHEDGDLDQCSVLDRAFHVQLARAAGMELLCPVIHRCALHMHRFTLGGLEVPREFFQESGVGAEHAALLETLLGSDPITAEQAMTDHLARVLQRWAPSLYQAAGPQAFQCDTNDGGQT